MNAVAELSLWLKGYTEGRNEGFTAGFNKAIELFQRRANAEAAALAARRGALQQAAASTDHATITEAEVRAGAAHMAAEPNGPLPPAQPSAPPPTRRKRHRKLTAAQHFVLLAITENPGATLADLRTFGVHGRGAIYDLVKHRKVRVERIPNTGRTGPRVRFYPVERSNAQA